MGQIGEILGLGLQARIELGRGASTIVDILRERMDGVDRSVRRASLKERLGLKGLGCCGPTWGLGPATMSVRDDDEEDDEHRHPLTPQIDVINAAHNPIQNGPIPPCSPGMNLAAALAAERQLRAALDFDTGGPTLSPSPSPDSNPPRPYGNRSPNPSPRAANATSVPLRVSLMRLLEETDGCDRDMKRERGGCDSVCCVCMGRKKGAAFIPCGHTFCRVCSREVWLNRGSCPLCNRSILEILDIY